MGRHLVAWRCLVLAWCTAWAVAAVAPERTVDIFAWPLSAATAEAVATVAFNATAATVQSASPPTIPPRDGTDGDPDDRLIRVGFYHPSGAWSGVATTAANWAAGKDQTLLLHVNAQGELYHVGFTAGDAGARGSPRGIRAEVVQVRPGPAPHLNRPVVVQPDGSVPEKEPEKTFLQK